MGTSNSTKGGGVGIQTSLRLPSQFTLWSQNFLTQRACLDKLEKVGRQETVQSPINSFVLLMQTSLAFIEEKTVTGYPGLNCVKVRFYMETTIELWTPGQGVDSLRCLLLFYSGNVILALIV